jgi:Platelet-activating factor acetylhydrolase, isoform II
MRGIALLAKILVGIGSCAFAAGVSIAASPSELPRPSGPLQIGRVDFDWIDQSREEVVTADRHDKREVIVRLFYPATLTSTSKQAQYFPNIDRIEKFEERYGPKFLQSQYGQSYPLLRTIKTHTFDRPSLRSRSAGYPVVLFSPGGGVPVTFYSTIIEDLVSNGYVVAGIEHPYDGPPLVLSSGRIATQVGWGDYESETPAERAAFAIKRYKVDAADQSFVLDQLHRLNGGELAGGRRFKGALNLGEVAAMGHSLGGKVSVFTCRNDPRVSFCLNLDGGLEHGLSFGHVAHPVAEIYGWRAPIRREGETDAAFEKRLSSMAAIVQLEKAQFSFAPPQSRLLLLDVPGYSHFSYFDLLTPETGPGPWYATPQQWASNHRLIDDIILTSLKLEFGRAPGGLAELQASAPEKLAAVHVEALGSWAAKGKSWQFAGPAAPVHSNGGATQ